MAQFTPSDVIGLFVVWAAGCVFFYFVAVQPFLERYRNTTASTAKEPPVTTHPALQAMLDAGAFPPDVPTPAQPNRDPSVDPFSQTVQAFFSPTLPLPQPAPISDPTETWGKDKTGSAASYVKKVEITVEDTLPDTFPSVSFSTEPRRPVDEPPRKPEPEQPISEPPPDSLPPKEEPPPPDSLPPKPEPPPERKDAEPAGLDAPTPPEVPTPPSQSMSKMDAEIIPPANLPATIQPTIPLPAIPPAKPPTGITLKLRRAQRTSVLGKVIFTLDARVQLEAEERALVSKYRLGPTIVYDSDTRKQHTETALQHLEDSRATGPVSSGKAAALSLYKVGRAGLSLAVAALTLRITIDSLVKGVHVECKSLDELLAAKRAIVEATESLRTYLDAASTFDGREEIIEF